MARSPNVRAIAEGMFTDAEKRDKLGAPVKLADVLELIKKAVRCSARSQNEAGWNLLVHMPLLQLAVHGGTLSSEGLVQVEPCTTATILAEYYRRPLTSSRKIDFVMVLDLVSPTTTLSSDRAASDAMDRIREGLPGCSINHTDFEPLEQCPWV
ncbi:hypothetical protein RB600_009175 [Gaeumannomyces tritici]